MTNTLPNRSNIVSLKSKFFLYRALIYFSFLLIPVWIQKSLDLNQALQSLVMVLYIGFMIGQWFLLGKEIDHRFKIYFRVNSTFDRILYRMLLGMITMILYFNLLSFLPSKWIYNLFWTTWVILGLFYSWPTRGKIIQESVSSNLNEIQYLDAFEKTLIGLIILFFVISVPELPNLTNIDALKLFFDPLEKHDSQLWNFLVVNYYPFKKYPALFKLAWCMHFYCVGMGVFLMGLYATLRFFVSRRLSLLGVFVVLSSWSFSKILGNNFGASMMATYSVIWVWSILWIARSSSYRAGLCFGLIGYLGSIINISYSFLIIFQLLIVYFFFLGHKTTWFRKKLVKYTILGIVLTALTLIFNFDRLENLQPINEHYYSHFLKILDRKAFFALSFLGIIIIFFKMILPDLKVIRGIKFDKSILIAIGTLIGYSFIFDAYLVKSFSLMWILTIFSLIPLELIFQHMSRLRPGRNMIFIIYILICILDSHFEGRVKIFIRLFKKNSDELVSVSQIQNIDRSKNCGKLSKDC